MPSIAGKYENYKAEDVEEHLTAAGMYKKFVNY